jgi:1,4-dihydroxy-2-naphthoate octaprenyltransferase
VIGFLTVFVFQGAVIFFIVYYACSLNKNISVPLIPCIVSSLLIGALYPLTQIYQHEADRQDGVTTISYMLGKREALSLADCFFWWPHLFFIFILSEKMSSIISSGFYYLLRRGIIFL